MKLSIIYASSRDGVIGRNNELPWYLPEDLKKFKEITSSGQYNVVLMGKNTFNSIGRALPKRENIVLTTDVTFSAENIITKTSIKDALSYIKEREKEIGQEMDVFVIGGEIVYKKFMEREELSKIYHTAVETAVKDGDTFFIPSLSGFELIKNERQYSEKGELFFYFREFDKIKE